ncbi:hypothetical protein AK88_03555 [Plasmodium fragile]|uniref:Plasmodium RESA N-terminal domain-containing protein n=1 Tax=Plasmodium fragile TaxID=5857 RepID=A0A0D9QM88_PLAFR|nr:uncharacterized protein AK88_03555 [Plasmodium fragile]KJP86846.1 hypothetical protein AK88_03555 [Plasmodium fragile]
MAHSNNKQTSTSIILQGASESRNGKTVSSSITGSKTHDKQAHRSFFKKFAILFVVACICLTHPDDFETQEERLPQLHVCNRVARSLAKGKATPSEDELELEQMEWPQGEHATGTLEDAKEGLYSHEQLDEEGKEDYYGQEEEAILEEWTPEEQEEQQEQQEQQVQEEVHYDGERNIEHDAREEEVHEDKRDEFLSGDSRKLDRNGTDSSIAFHYEMTCFDERLRDSEINKRLEQMEEEPHKWELLSLYWQSYRNERSKYLALKKSLQEKFIELQKKQTIASVQIYNNKWKKCEEIINNNLTKQNEHVNEVFRTMVAKEKLSTYEFEKILYDFRESWKEVTIQTKNECIALLEEPILLEVIYIQIDTRNIGMRISGLTVPGIPY